MKKPLLKSLTRVTLWLAAVLVLFAPAISLAQGEAYYWQDSSRTQIVGTGGVYDQTTTFAPATQAANGDATYTASDPTACPSQTPLQLQIIIHQGDLSPPEDQTPASLTETGCSAGADSGITIFTDQSSAKIATTGVKCTAPAGLSWAICPVYNFILSSIQKIEQDVIVPFLQVNPIVVGQTSAPSYQIWLAVRNLADVFFIIAFLVIIFANTLSIGLDSYTLKKTLPRLVYAAILVQFSYLLVALAVDITNILGAGIGSLVLGPLQGHTGVHFDFATGVAGIATGIAAAVAAVGSVMTGSILVILIGAFFTMIAVFLTLVARQILVTFLLIIGPLAVACWILPGTEHLFKLWHKSLVRLLLMYPLIVLLLASGKIFAVVTLAGSGGGAANGSLRSLISVLANIVPLFLIPLTFKYAGAALTSISNLIGTLNNAAKTKAQGTGYHERLKARTQQRRTELAAGQKLKGFGLVTGNRVAAQVGRGVFTPPTNASNIRAMVDFSKESGEWKKRIEEEGMTYEGIAYLSRGRTWYDQERSDTLTKQTAARGRGDTVAADSLDDYLKRLDEGRAQGDRYINNSAARAAAVKKLSDFDVLDTLDRTQLQTYTQNTKAGQYISRQVWHDAREGARKTNVNLAFTDINGNLDVEGLEKFVAKKTTGNWTEYTKPAIEEMARTGILDRLAASRESRDTLISIMGSQGGPSIGAEQQAIIKQALRRTPPPAGTRPDPANL